MRVLLVEDDPALTDLVRHALLDQHYLVETAADGQTGWEMAEVFAYDLILLDLMLPHLDGMRFCQQLRVGGPDPHRSPNRDTPILFMTAQSTSTDKVAGLDAGADDYLVKPFSLDELLARVRALLRRGKASRSPLLRWGKVQLDPSPCQVTILGQPIHLSAKEYNLLELFLRSPKRIFSHSCLIEQLWALEEVPTENAVRAQIKGLRKKLKDAGVPEILETVYGLGYRLREESDNRQQQEPEAITPTMVPASPAPIQTTTEALFAQFRSGYCQRLQVIEQAVVALRQQNLSEELRLQACREAHTLKGSLGLFELDEASQLARDIEQRLKQPEMVAQVGGLEQQVAALKQCLVAGASPESGEPVPAVDTAALTSLPSLGEGESFAKILIVDDDRAMLERLNPILQPWGFELTLLSHPQQFWNALAQSQPDLVILDVEMPEMSGIELCQAIRQDEQWSELPVLFLSAHNDDATLQQIFTVGADDYVSKPVRDVELVARVLRRLEQARLLRQWYQRRPS